jgi:hypothetical protein
MRRPRFRITIRGLMIVTAAAAFESWLVVSSRFGYVIALSMIGPLAGVL